MSIKTEYGTVVVDTNLVPYMRSREVEFTARNLKPYKTAGLFFDEVVVNQFSQVGNKVEIDTKKVIRISSNNSATTPTAGHTVYQGASSLSSTFSATVDSYESSNTTVVLEGLTGNFDETAPLYFVNGGSVTYANARIVTVSNLDTSDVFYPGEGVVTPESNCFATVIATTGEDVVYLNQNYHNINVVATNGSTLADYVTRFKVGDLVFQTTNGENRYDLASYRGYVQYINIPNSGSEAWIAIKPIDGTLDVTETNTNTTANVRLWSVTDTSSPKPLHIKSFNLSGFPVNQHLRSVANSSANIKITNYNHNSGVLANTLNSGLSQILLPTNANTSFAAGNLIYFVSGTGVGSYKMISSVSGQTVTLSSALSADYGSNTHYSIGNFIVDDTGCTAGVFHIPSYPNFKFKTGNRIFTVTDTPTVSDPDYTMRAAASFVSGGILKTTQRIQTTPTLQPLPEVDADSLVRPVSPAERAYNTDPVKNPTSASTGSTTPRIALGDGLSQTFFTPKPKASANKQDYGMFISSIDLFFKSKPSVALGAIQLPITVKIAEVQNGFPTKNYLASKTIQAKDVKISNTPSTSNAATVTKFTFDDPVYLEPTREYALVLGSESPDYEVYIAELGQNVLGAVPDRRISEQPYSGSFFRSQNSSTWTPYQNQDLMFVINKCVFHTAGEATATFNLSEAPKANSFVDKVNLLSADLEFPVTDLVYELKGVYANNTGTEYESGNGIELTKYSPVEYGALLDKSNKTSINRRKLLKGNVNSYLMAVSMSSADVDISPVVNIERLGLTASRFLIDNAGISNSVISVIGYGSGYNAVITSANVTAGQEKILGTSDAGLTANAAAYRQYIFANNANIGFYAIDIAGGGGSGAAGFAVANTDGQSKVNYIVITNPGSGYLTNPTINIRSGNASSNSNATAIINGENSKSGGNILAKYVTREIVLEDGFESGDLRVFMDAIRSTGTDINVYYKVKSGEDNDRFSDKSWQLMSKNKDVFSKNAFSIIGLEFRPDLLENKLSYVENGVSYPIGGKFKSFAVKVCMTSTDPSLVPKIRNLRIIATPEG
jgi:hypothetical protein